MKHVSYMLRMRTIKWLECCIASWHILIVYILQTGFPFRTQFLQVLDRDLLVTRMFCACTTTQIGNSAKCLTLLTCHWCVITCGVCIIWKDNTTWESDDNFLNNFVVTSFLAKIIVQIRVYDLFLHFSGSRFAKKCVGKNKSRVFY
jgi:hypothetical protein